MTREEVMEATEMDDDEFDDLYTTLLTQIRQYRTIAVEGVFRFVEQELTVGREEIE